ncbi:9275_t:CDS:2, partial [Dentiscutata erythropus]
DLSTEVISLNTNFDADIDTRNNDNSLDLLDDNFIFNNNEALDRDISDNNIILSATLINNNSTKIFVGQTFDDWQKVEKCINVYAISKEFVTRLQYTNKIMGLTTRAKIVCCRAGTPSNKIMFDPGYRKLSNSEKSHIQMLYNRGMPVPTIVNMLTEQYNRYIHNKDVYNALNNQSKDYVNGLSETANLLNSLSNNDEYKVTYLINNGKLYCLFFTTHSALVMFKYYPEILLMDSTYKTNHFGIPLLLICGIDAIDFKTTIVESDENQFNILWNCLLTKHPEAKTYMVEQWKHFIYIWVYCYINKNINYGIRTTQQSEASNVHLKCLLSHTVPLPKLISALKKLSNHQLQHPQYQQYRLRESIRQQCSKLLKDISIVISDFVYFILLEQYNTATVYKIEMQEG